MISKYCGLLILCFTLAFASSYAETKVLAFAGSTRKDSFNKKLINEAANEARALGADVKVISLEDYPMPYYDGDLETQQGQPDNAKKIRQLMMQSQVIMIASPEYNGSLSAILKNTIDWASRNEQGAPSRDAFAGKTFVLLSTSPGNGGGSRGLAHLRAIIENVGGTVLTQQVTVPKAYEAFDNTGHLKDPKAKMELHNLIQQAVQ